MVFFSFAGPEFVAAIERDYRWRHGYLDFLHDLRRDPGESRSLVGDGDVRMLIRRILPRHVDGLSADGFIDRWLREDIELNLELLDVIPRVTVESVYLLTNQDAVRGSYIASLYSDRLWLSGVLASHEIGHVKPERAFFEGALARIDRKPHECLFVDDNFGFVDGALAVGIPSIHFRGNRELIAELKTLGLLEMSI
jgi:HAD superfamily hydrolase (TIGR01509 family)